VGTIAGLLLSVWIFSTPSAAFVERVYQINQYGAQIGTETSRIQEQNGSYLITSYTEIKFGETDLTFQSDLTVTGDAGGFEAYSLRLTSPSGTQTFQAALDGDEAVCFLQNGEQAERRIKLHHGAGILNRMVAAHYQLVADRVPQTSDVEIVAHFLVPQEITEVMLSLANLGRSAVEFRGKNVETRLIRGRAGQGPHLFFEVDDEGTMLSARIPSQGLEILLSGVSPKDKAGSAYQSPGNIAYEEVVVRSSDVEIAGSLSSPIGRAQTNKLVVFVPGSGPTDRNGNNPLMAAPVDFIKEIAEYLTSQGITCYRYDKRGVGASSHVEVPALAAYVGDIVAVAEKISAMQGMEEYSVYLLGHSEGALLAALAATRIQNVRGLVLLAPPGRPVEKSIEEQIQHAAQRGDLTEDEKTEGLREFRSMVKTLKNGKPYDPESVDVPMPLKRLFLSLAGQPDFSGPLLSLDPATEIAALDPPVAVFRGSEDIQISPEEFDGLLSAFRASGKQDFTSRTFEGLDHLFKYTESSSQSEYADPRRRVSKEFLEFIADWIKSN
jgi:pimeloyl-ACP methyl ester carboxylesterase